MKIDKKYQALPLLIVALIAMFFGCKAIITQEAVGFITSPATPLSITYYGKDAVVIGVIMLVIAVFLFWWVYKTLK